MYMPATTIHSHCRFSFASCLHSICFGLFHFDHIQFILLLFCRTIGCNRNFFLQLHCSVFLLYEIYGLSLVWKAYTTHRGKKLNIGSSIKYSRPILHSKCLLRTVGISLELTINFYFCPLGIYWTNGIPS